MEHLNGKEIFETLEELVAPRHTALLIHLRPDVYSKDDIIKLWG